MNAVEAMLPELTILERAQNPRPGDRFESGNALVVVHGLERGLVVAEYNEGDSPVTIQHTLKKWREFTAQALANGAEFRPADEVAA